LDDVPGVSAAFDTMTSYLAYRATNPFAPPLLLPTLRNLKDRRVRRFLDQVAAQIVDQRRKSEVPRADLLTTLLSALDPETDQGLTKQALQREVQIMIGVGETTTSEALTFCFAFLGSHPEVLSRVTRQIDQLVGQRRVALADVPKLTILRQVLSEALRLCPPSYVIARAPTQDVHLGGVRLRRGSSVLNSAYALHRDARWWSEPTRFMPDRFDAHGLPLMAPRYAYLPFGAARGAVSASTSRSC
jgi:cytochrome P450